MFAATMAAAFLGNTYYHVLMKTGVYSQLGYVEVINEIFSYLFYAFLLGIGVFIGMSNEQRRRGKQVKKTSLWMSRLIALKKIAGVWIFFSLIRIWGNPRIPFFEETRFFFSLFGISF